MPAPHGAQARFALPHAVLTDWPAGQFWHVSHVSAIPVVSQYSVASHFEENVVPQESWVCAHAQLAQNRASAALRGCTPAIVLRGRWTASWGPSAARRTAQCAAPDVAPRAGALAARPEAGDELPEHEATT